MDCPRKELINTYYFYEGGGGRREAVEEGRGGRYKEGDRMVEEGIFFGEYFGDRIFTKEGSKEGDGTVREENWRRGLTPEEELHP